MCMDKVKDWLFGEEEGYTEDYNTAQNGQEENSNIFENNKTKKTSEMLKPFDANSSPVLFEPRAYSDSQEIGPKIFLCTPKNIGVTGSITLDDDTPTSTEE